MSGFQTHKDALTIHAEELYIVRYVDNRLVLCGQHLADKWFMQEFLADLFYRHPDILLNLRMSPTESFLARPFRSAGTESARICLASRYYFPDHLRGKPRPTKASCSMQLMMLTILTMKNGNQIDGGDIS